MEYETIQFRKKGPIATITLNRARYLNALNVAACNELLDVIKKCRWDDKIRVVVLTGAGKAFCSGGDVRAMMDFIRDNPQDDAGKIIENIVSVFNLVVLGIRQLKKPVIAAVNGFCSGGGAGLAQACDIILATKSAKLHIPNASIGLVPDGGNSFFLAQNLGRYRAMELVFSGGSLDAQEAYRLGIFNRLVEEEDLLPETEKMAERLAQGPWFAMGLAKNMLDQALSGTLETQLELEKEMVVRCGGTAEFKERITAFFEKRKQ